MQTEKGCVLQHSCVAELQASELTQLTKTAKAKTYTASRLNT